MKIRASILLVLTALCAQSVFCAEGNLRRIEYNNPGLVADLGVGLWAWPMPMDFDGDGDSDIAAISFYPDFASEAPESFVLLQNDGDMSFSAHTDPSLSRGRWMTMDAGDMDGDGDVDVILGGAKVPTGMFAFMDVFEELAKTAPAVLILKNQSAP